jgi:hypothetical protein
MRIIRSIDDLDADLTPGLQCLVAQRLEMLAEYGEDLARVLIPQSGDTMADVEKAIGLPLTAWECVLDHGGLYEAPFVLDDYGHGILLLVPDEEGIDPSLLSACRSNAQPANSDI